MRNILVLALCFAAVAAAPQYSQRIVGGTVTTIEKWPFIASLLYSRYGDVYSQSCAGTIINNRAILSAAHCFGGDTPISWRVRVGSTNANSGGNVYNVNQLTLHPDFSSRTLDSDIALVLLSSVITFRNVIQPGNLAASDYNLGNGATVTALGWGSTSFEGSPSEELREVNVWVVDPDTCKFRYAAVRQDITENQVCAGWLDVGGRDQCQGDAGGPLLNNGVVVGVSSFGYGCGSAYLPGVNTRVSRFASWIRNNA